MIIIALLLIFSLYLFLYFDHKRKSRNTRYRNSKKEKLETLLQKIREEDDEEQNNTTH